MLLMALRMALAGVVIAAGFWLKGAGPAGIVGLVAVSEAPCGMMGINLAARSGEQEMLGQGRGWGIGTACSGVAMGAEVGPPHGEQKILSLGTGGGPSGTGGGRGSKAWVGSHIYSCQQGGSSGRMTGAGGGGHSSGGWRNSNKGQTVGEGRATGNKQAWRGSANRA